MRSFILIGGEDQKENYIHKYIQNQQIPSYNVVLFSEPLKIADARQIIKSLNFTNSGGKRRVVIIKGNPNTESQNALLKTIEELDEETDFIFANESELLPTIISRSTIVRLTREEEIKQESNSMSVVRDILEMNDLLSSICLIDKYFSDKNEDLYQNFILHLRQILLSKISEKDFSNAVKIYSLLKMLTCKNRLVLSNNLNPRIVFERIFIENSML